MKNEIQKLQEQINHINQSLLMISNAISVVSETQSEIIHRLFSDELKETYKQELEYTEEQVYKMRKLCGDLTEERVQERKLKYANTQAEKLEQLCKGL